MATYTELNGLFNDPTLSEKVGVAIIVAADIIRAENSGTTNHANRLKWAKQVYKDPNGNRDDMLKAVLAANRTLTVAQITGASDADIQTAVNAAVDVFADGNS